MILRGQELAGRNGHEAGCALLGQMFREHTGRELPQICRSPSGKPFIDGENIHFSLSHTKEHVFCVLSAEPVGLDAEEMDRQIDLRLAKKILSPEEYAQFLQAEDQRLALLTFWVLKEAQVKFTGEGLRGYPNHTNFSLDDPRVRVLNGCLVAIIGNGGGENAV